jgi:hypothetical protein
VIDSTVAEFDRRAVRSRPNSFPVELGTLRALKIGSFGDLRDTP